MRTIVLSVLFILSIIIAPAERRLLAERSVASAAAYPDSGKKLSDASTERGALISAEKIESMSVAQIGASLRASGIRETASTGGTVYRLVYRTIDPHGRATTASGALTIPDARSGPLPLVSYQHGTVLNRKDVASVYGFDVSTALLTGAGYMVAAPDYLGLGVSPGMHPYMHAASLSTAIVDMLRASRAFCERERIALAPRVFLLGYSEGGYATLAAARELEGEHAAEFPLAGVAPMAGPYYPSSVMYEMLMSDDPYSHPIYLPYVVLGYNEVYHLFDSLDEVFDGRYVDPIRTIFSTGNYAPARRLPSVPKRMLNDAFLAAFEKDETHPLRVALRENDLRGWCPSAPLRLYHGTADEQVPYRNALAANKEFGWGCNRRVELMPINGATHGSGMLPSLVGARHWFDSLRTVAAAQ